MLAIARAFATFAAANTPTRRGETNPNSRTLKRNKRRGRQRKLVHAQPLPQEIKPFIVWLHGDDMRTFSDQKHEHEWFMQAINEHISTALVASPTIVHQGFILPYSNTPNFDFDTHFILIQFNVTILTIVLSERRTTIYFLLSRSAGMNVHTHSATQAKKAYMLNGRNWAKPGRAVCKRIARLQLNPAIAGPIARAREAAL